MAEPEKTDWIDEIAGTAGNTAAPMPPARKPPPLAEKSDDLESLRTAVVDAAGVGFGIWITYLGTLFYLAIAAGGVTHKDLFFELPVKLPFLNVDLPLKGFFSLAPIVFVLLHIYVLLHFVMLAGKIAAFDWHLLEQIDYWLRAEGSPLRRARPDPPVRERAQHFLFLHPRPTRRRLPGTHLPGCAGPAGGHDRRADQTP